MDNSIEAPILPRQPGMAVTSTTSWNRIGDWCADMWPGGRRVTYTFLGDSNNKTLLRETAGDVYRIGFGEYTDRVRPAPAPG